MDVITPFLKIAYAILKKYWPYIAIGLLLLLLFIVFQMFQAERKAHMITELERQRTFSNAMNLEKEVSEYSQVVSLTKAEIKRMENIQEEFRVVSEKLKVSENKIQRLHVLKSVSNHTEKLVIKKDTVYVDSSGYEINRTVAINSGCVTGTAYWKEGADTATLDIEVNTDLVIADYVEKSKGYAGRDAKRFFTFRWRLIGSDKWDAKVIVINNCDPGQVYEKNILINQLENNKKRRKK